MEEINSYFILDEIAKNKLSKLKELYEDWNSQINVISRKDIDNFYEHHVLHSLAIAKIVSFRPSTKVLDLGTGGGFPGVPLAILFPEVQFTLVDSIGKKLKVIEDVCEKLDIKNVKTIHSRVEEIDEDFDFVVSRAVTKLDEAWSWVEKKISSDNKNETQNGMLYLKGGVIDSELPKNVKYKRYEISDYFKQDFFKEKSIIHIYKI